jgi:hypothetical protein
MTIDRGRIYFAGRSTKTKDKQPMLMCLDLYTGKQIWETGIGGGIRDIPIIEGDRIYIRGGNSVYCLNLKGEIIWNSKISQPYFSGVQHGPAGTGLVLGGQFWIPTGHAPGSDCPDFELNSLESPFHPNVVVLDKQNGKLLAQDNVSVGHIQHGQWTTLSAGEVNGKWQVFFASAAGTVHAFEVPSIPASSAGTRPAILREIWRCDANPEKYRRYPDGKPIQYHAYNGMPGPGPDKPGPLEIISMPVFYQGLLYVPLSRDVEYGMKKKLNADDKFSSHRTFGLGCLVCIDPKGSGDVTRTHKVWENTDVNWAFFGPSITGDLMFFADLFGQMNCIELKTGKILWQYDIECSVWNYGQVTADGKIYVTTEKKDFFIFSATREPKLLFRTKLDALGNPPQPVVTDGLLIVSTGKTLSAYFGPGYKTNKTK